MVFPTVSSQCVSAGNPVLSPATIYALGTTECPEPLCLAWVLPIPGRHSVSPQWMLLHLHCSYRLMRQSYHLSLLSFRMKTVFAGCCQPLLVLGPSRHYLCNPCVGAWTHTPLCSSIAHTHFFMDDIGRTLRETRSAHRITPMMRLQ
jgi:hypothetical protein